ncbi:hypothetical protein CAPN008_01370 [Capnocytophaga canis]|uniref:DUF6706 family protein n=1 Tax=Capnocytophaga canis TaxID=1848903 RepID=UPI001ACC5AE6|nr:DUF6706 family protein [Capnocytophaga canis]GIM60087.1 hypothetical protein CAPN008_01370 [Capnocytophaga canis]
MTNKEYITQSLSQFGITPQKVDLILFNSGLEANEDADISVVKKALYDNVRELLQGYSNVSEGGTSLTFDRDNLLRWYDLLCDELGLPNPLGGMKRIISDASNLW